MSSPSRRNFNPDNDIEDEQKRKRKLSNRESAKRSRARKQQRVEELIAETSHLQAENARLKAELGKVNGENAVLRALHGEPNGRLQGGFQVAAAAIPDIANDLQHRPWQLPLAPQQAAAPNTQHTLGGFQVAGAAVDIAEFPNDPMLCALQPPFAPQPAPPEQTIGGFQVASAAVNIQEISNDQLPWLLPLAPQPSADDMAEVLPSEDTEWTLSCIDMDSVDAYYDVLNIPKNPNDC
jgi:hypothetical protein